jgi:transposase InsO family protein/transposase-like protein
MNKTKTPEPQTVSPETPQSIATTKRYDEAIKREAVENWIKSGQRGTQIAAELGVSYPSLKDWKRRYMGDATPARAGLAEENRALKIELARVREQRDILKKNAGHPLRTVEERYPRIERMKGQHSIAQWCATLGVRASGYYAWVQAPPSRREQQDARLCSQIQALHTRPRGRYGAPRVRAALVQQGEFHGTKRIARLMKQAGLRGPIPKRYVPHTTKSDHDQPIAANRLARVSAPTGPNQIWVSDLTYVATGEGWLYVAIVLDLWSRQVVGWSTGASLAASLAVGALQMALCHRQPPRGLLHHSDRGIQYASGEYRTRLAAAGIEPSMSRAGNPYDNAAMESFNATYKRECVGLAEERGGYATRPRPARTSSSMPKCITTGSGSTAPSAINPLWTLNTN